MIAHIRDVVSPAIREVYHDWLGTDDRLLMWDVSTTPTVSLCESETCQTATVDEDGDRVHESFVVFLRMIFAQEESQNISCYIIPGDVVFAGRITEALHEVRVRQEFDARAEEMADLREVGESIIQEYRP